MSETDGRGMTTAPAPDRADLTRDQFSNDESYYLATGRRTAPTPEYLRVLADDVQHTVDNGYEFAPENVVAALRTAADWIEVLEKDGTDESVHHELRTPAVRSSATEFGAKVDGAAFDAWLNKVVDDSFKSGYTLARQRGRR